MKVVIGVGNVFMKDDSCGSFIAQALDGLIPIDVKDLGMGS
jgi:Ni,Fe-hydrogenase maturation factor